MDMIKENDLKNNSENKDVISNISPLGPTIYPLNVSIGDSKNL